MLTAHEPETIPVLDIEPFLTGDNTAQKTAAEAVDRINRTLGFLIITGHGVDLDLRNRLFAASKAFFEGPQVIKDATRPPDPHIQQGYHATNQSSLAAKQGQHTPPDMREYFMFGRKDLTAPYFQTAAAREFHHENIWPPNASHFRQCAERYFLEIDRFGATMMRLFARALGQQENWFDDKIDRNFSIVSSIYYPPQSTTPPPGQLRAGAHTDYGSLTILAPADGHSGLQIATRSGRWVDVPNVPGAFIVNIGDMMQHWTNGRWLSNLHRVINPPPANAGAPRQAIAYFLHPNYDAKIECIPSCATTANAAHPAVTAGTYMKEREQAITQARVLIDPV